jgi:hypothetical protein
MLPPEQASTYGGEIMRLSSRLFIATAVTGAAFAGTAAGSTAAPSAPSAAQAAATRHVEGTVASVNRGARTFRLRDTERGTVTIRVNGSTSFERIAGFSALRRAMSRVEATVRRSNGGWVATRVERSGGGGRHGGSGRRGGEDD